MSEQQPGLFGDVFLTEKPKHAIRADRPFMPWHKPRKQWIREYQWLHLVDQLCQKLALEDRPTLRYLSLPGEDLLDIRVIQRCCEKRSLRLKYLGLNDQYGSMQPDTSLHIAWNEVNSLESIDRRSVVIPDRFEAIADRESQAFRYVQDYGPFDVVNLDLCESISPRRRRANEPNYYEALRSLADYQIRSRTEPWLLLITSRVRPSKVASGDMKKLIACVRNNISRHSDFAQKCYQAIPPTAALARRRRVRAEELEQADFLKLFSAGLSKWLLKLMSSGNPKWGVSLQASYSYRVYGDTPDMVSYAFLLEAFVEGPYDATGLSRGTRLSERRFDERLCALDLLDGIGKIVDLDAMLDSSPSLKAEMEDASAKLLGAARYNPADYREQLKTWAGR